MLCGPKLPMRGTDVRRATQPARVQSTVVSPVAVRAAALGTTQSTSGTPPRSTSMKEMASQMKAARSQMEENEQVRVLMNGFRGTNQNDQDFASSGVVMQLVEMGADDEQLPLSYEPDVIASYYDRRPVSVVTRIAQLLGISGKFLSSLLSDWATGKLRDNEVLRAQQLRDIVTSLGPAYIKLGQALSIRPDLLSPAAMNELQKLCDKVPSFDSKRAMAVIKEELGDDWHQVYAELSPEPIAAASLGQVYKGKLKTGEIVAVKVQRPYVLETVTIDLYIIRKLGLFLKRFPAITTDVVALLDEWAARFFEELDYVHEGQNATKFAAQMARDLPQVVVPRTYFEYTSRRVMTTEWLEGEKLSQSKADDVGTLVNIGVICYLKQLLETGFFHADPHPGNLIRTPDGRLAILDFGLMTQVDDNIKFGMIEAISHLIHRDYEAIVKDFVTLDFIPEGTDLRPILPVLAKVFDQALAGGGAKSINFQELAADLAQITFDYPFRIPPYFALIIRAIATLEGIALVGNPDFAIVDEAYPYIAKRLLTDDTPRLRAALRYMVYGREGVFDADRLIDLLTALESFVDSANSARGDMDESTGLVMAGRQSAALPAPAGGGFSTVGDASGSSRQQPGFPFPFPFPLPGGPSASTSGSGAAPPFGLPFPFPFPSVLVPAPSAMLSPLTSLASLLPASSLTRAFLLGSSQQQAATAMVGSSSAGVLDLGSGGLSAVTKSGGSGGATRAALRFMLSPEGLIFREFIMDELVKAIDALSREQAVVLVQRMGLDGVQVPLLLPGAKRATLPLAPTLSSEDRAVVDNLSKLIAFFTQGQRAASFLRTEGSDGSGAAVAVVSELMPVLPSVATEVVPQLMARLTSRVVARIVRDVYM